MKIVNVYIEDSDHKRGKETGRGWREIILLGIEAAHKRNQIEDKIQEELRQ